MQRLRNLIKKYIHNIKNIPKKVLKSKKLTIVIILLLIILFTCITILTTISIQKKIQEKEQLANKPLIEYELKELVSEEEGKVLIKFNSIDGFETIKYTNEKEKEIELKCNGKNVIGLDYLVTDRTDYKFKIKINGQPEKEETMHFEIPRIKGNYVLIDGIYVNEPDLSGWVKENTRYLCLNENGKLVPNNWITEEQPQNWYNYKNQNWANIYVESKGVESTYVWIPRYVYKQDNEKSIPGNERMDVKFVNTYNEYINNETGETISWNELKEQGYKLPEAFAWQNSNEEPLIIPGYWMSKYQLSELGSSYKINYNLQASKTAFNVNHFTNNVSSQATSYTYAINGKIVKTSATLEEYAFENVNSEESVINITALDTNGCIVGSMTKKFELTQCNAPDLTGFDKNTTFYVYWDEQGNEHNEIPISMEPPEEWYNYSYSKWANIVSRNNGLESYYVWIPRYQYMVDQTSQRSEVQFIMGTGTETMVGYKIPEAFTWGDDGEKQLTGYWMSKYQLSLEEASEKITAQMSPKDTLIRVGDIRGTLITNAQTEGTNLQYEYYINGNKVHEGTNNAEHYVYENLELNKEYTINIIARNVNTNAYIGAITKKVKTQEAYQPDLTGFDKETTYYVTYDGDGTEKERISIKEEMPNDWYDYSKKRWANIVTTANETQSYFVWIPRYEYKIEADRPNLSLKNRRAEVNFVTTEITNNNCTTGYKVPEAFTWGDNGEKQLKGYWMSKYQLSQ